MSNIQKSSMRRINGEIPEEKAHTSIKTSQQPDRCMVDGLMSAAILTHYLDLEYNIS